MVLLEEFAKIMQQKNSLIKNGWYIFKFDPVMIGPDQYSPVNFVLVASRYKLTIDGKNITA